MNGRRVVASQRVVETNGATQLPAQGDVSHAMGVDTRSIDPIHHCRATPARGRGAAMAGLRLEHPDQPLYSLPVAAIGHRSGFVERSAAGAAALENSVVHVRKSRVGAVIRMLLPRRRT